MDRALITVVLAALAGPSSMTEESGCVSEKDRLRDEVATLREMLAEQERQAQAKQQYYLQAAENRLLLDTPQRQRSAQVMRDAVFAAVQDKTDAARLLDGIYGGIQRRSDTWISLYGYDPIDKNLKLDNPIKALILLKSSAQKLKENIPSGEKPPDPALKMLQYNLGNEEGALVYKLDLISIANTAYGITPDVQNKKERDK